MANSNVLDKMQNGKEQRARTPDDGDAPIIHAGGLTKQFGGEYAVRDVGFDVPRGKIFGFIGPSGSGKTTTVRLLTGIYEPTAGEARVLGQPPAKFNRAARERIGYMAQLFALYPNLTVWENLNFAASVYGMGLVRGKRLRQVLDFVELTAHRHKRARDLSAGMQRRLSLAATLVNQPELVFLDEPTAGLDPVLRRKFWDHFKELQGEGRTFFVTTQYVAEAAYCDLVGVIIEGRLLMVETPLGLKRRAYGGDLVDLHTSRRLDYDMLQQLKGLPFSRGRAMRLEDNNGLRLIVKDAGTAIPDLVAWLGQQKIEIASINEYVPPYDDVFVAVVKNEETASRSERNPMPDSPETFRPPSSKKGASDA